MVDYSSLDEKILGFIDNYYDKFYIFNTIGFETAKFDIDNEIIADLTYAIKKTKKINFTYSRYGNVRQYKNFSPFRIIVTEDSWYLYGELEDDENKEIAYRVFVLNYISDIEITNKSFKIPDDIDFIVSRAKTIWFIVRKERVKITAELKPPVSTKVLELKDSFHYFTNQKIIEKRDDGTVLIEFYTVDDNYKQADFKNQVYHWFPDIKIISPKKFVDLIKSDMEEMLGNQ
jgi:predicted DNA-binding transcriptional regulator YafY